MTDDITIVIDDETVPDPAIEAGARLGEFYRAIESRLPERIRDAARDRLALDLVAIALQTPMLSLFAPLQEDRHA